MPRCSLLVVTLALLFPTTFALGWQIPEGVTSTQNPKDKPLTPQEALKNIELPEGFNVTLFAGEPDVAQPIAFCFDDRGRLWVAECYSYRRWDPKGEKGHDRIVILEDENHDGEFDKRTIFAENLANLTGIEIGFGGVWICSAPNLYFIPDKNRDDKPDGPAVSKIDGWVVGKVGHNIFNGLTWGPDGWLYGCHGIQDESHLGKPGTPDDQRIKMRCGIWRYHPVKEKIEVVCHGTTNPWGLDFNEYGDGFFTNCVIGHLWHMIPGAHYKRMYGEDYMTHSYELIDQHADHLHWVGEKWGNSRGNKPEQDKAGGGHAHVGAMIYLGDNWPEEYRSMIGMCNVHGQRLNFDKLERHGSGYVGRRGHDLFFAHDDWFRGITVKYGPDGGVFISDWCDYGECHDNDGVHTHSGRIYKVVYRDARKQKLLNLAELSNQELLQLFNHSNQWYARRAQRILQERAAAGDDMTDVSSFLKIVAKLSAKIAEKDKADTGTAELRSLLALHVIGGGDEAYLLECLQGRNVHVRKWAIRLLVEEENASKTVLKQFAQLAMNDPSPIVRLELASALQRIPNAERWPIAEGLVSHGADNDDHNLPLMIWYGIEPAVAADKEKALALAAKCKISKVRQFIAKRVASGSN